MKKKLIALLAVVVLCAVGTTVLFWPSEQPIEPDPIVEPTPTPEVSVDPDTTEKVVIYDPYFELSHDELSEINDRYVGKITVGNLIHETIVHSRNNADYLNYNLKREPNGLGTVFMDYQNKRNMSDQNIILYGHYVYYDDELKFTPLYKMMSQEIFDENKYITLDLIDETRYYEIVSIHYYKLGSEGVEYDYTSYTKSYFNNYMNHVQKNNRIKTEETISYEDKMLTLQTCVRDREDLRLIVIAKQIESVPEETAE